MRETVKLRGETSKKWITVPSSGAQVEKLGTALISMRTEQYILVVILVQLIFPQPSIVTVLPFWEGVPGSSHPLTSQGPL